MPGDDLEAVVKFVHKKDSIKGWSSYNTKAKRVAFLASLVPVWTERVACDVPAVPRRGLQVSPRVATLCKLSISVLRVPVICLALPENYL